MKTYRSERMQKLLKENPKQAYANIRKAIRIKEAEKEGVTGRIDRKDEEFKYRKDT
jgi:hypothetical protein